MFIVEILRKYFWMTVQAINKFDFDVAMGKIKEIEPAGYKWLMENEPNTWAVHRSIISLRLIVPVTT